MVRFHVAPRTHATSVNRVLAEGIGTLPRVKAFRRGALMIGLAVLVGLVLRVRGKGVPVTTGGWRELEGPDFR